MREGIVARPSSRGVRKVSVTDEESAAGRKPLRRSHDLARLVAGWGLFSFTKVYSVARGDSLSKIVVAPVDLSGSAELENLRRFFSLRCDEPSGQTAVEQATTSTRTLA